MSVKVFTCACNRIDFIEYQHKTLEAFLVDDYEFIVINDGGTEEIKVAIGEECDRLGIVHYETPGNLLKNTGSVAAAATMQWMYDEIILKKYSDSLCLNIDSDMFLYRKFSAVEFMGTAGFCGLPQWRGPVEHFWNGVLFMNIPKMPEPETLLMFCGIVKGQNVDNCGFTHYYMQRSDVELKRLVHTSHIHSSNNNLHIFPPEVLEEYNEEFRVELLQNAFLHYGSGTNWRFTAGTHDFLVKGDCTPEKSKFVFWLLDELVNGNVCIGETDYVFPLREE